MSHTQDHLTQLYAPAEVPSINTQNSTVHSMSLLFINKEEEFCSTNAFILIYGCLHIVVNRREGYQYPSSIRQL